MRYRIYKEEKLIMQKPGKIKNKISLNITPTAGSCPVGEAVGVRSIKAQSIPVLSCEGACIRGEIARQAANIIGKEPKYQRGCHGELFSVPDSKIARWIRGAEKVICVDGCFLRCHSRILENIIDPAKLVVFDALSHYNKYTDIFDIDDVPEAERKKAAQGVAQWVLKSLNKKSA